MLEIEYKLKDLDTKLKTSTLFIRGKLTDINQEFLTLVTKLKQYELNFVLPVNYDDKISIVDTDADLPPSFLNMPSRLWMPNRLYASYTRY